jgi:hypothetical protein
MSSRAAIPDFIDGDARSMSITLRAIKQEIETLSGARQGQSKGAPSVFLQEREPAQTLATTFKQGDFWINPTTKKLSFYNGKFWVQL